VFLVTFGESLTSLFAPWPSIELRSMISFATSSSRNFLFHLEAIGNFMLSLSMASFFSPHKSSRMCRCGDFALIIGLVIEEGVRLLTFEHDGIRNELDIYVFSLIALQNVCPMEACVTKYSMLEFCCFIIFDNNPCGFNSIHTC
jgi:hypothetical protein